MDLIENPVDSGAVPTTVSASETDEPTVQIIFAGSCMGRERAGVGHKPAFTP